MELEKKTKIFKTYIQEHINLKESIYKVFKDKRYAKINTSPGNFRT
jgi:hypothetical protein